MKPFLQEVWTETGIGWNIDLEALYTTLDACKLVSVFLTINFRVIFFHCYNIHSLAPVEAAGIRFEANNTQFSSPLRMFATSLSY